MPSLPSHNDLAQISNRHAVPPLPAALVRRRNRVRDRNRQALAYVYFEDEPRAARGRELAHP
jgi:hypothetical protein